MRRLLLAFLLITGAAAQAPAPVYWIVRYGQSLSIGWAGACGNSGNPACSSGAPYGSLTIFAPNSMYPPSDTQFRTLAGHTYQNSAPAIESSATSMCNQYNVLSGGRICATSDYGWPGAAYASLKKGAACTIPYCLFDNSVGNGGAAPNTGVVQAKAMAAASGSPFYAPAVYYNQGEAEMNGSLAASTYEGYMVQLQSDYQSSINGAIGQTGLIPLFLVQKSSWATWGTPRATPTSTTGADGVAIGQLQACLDHYSDGTIFCVGPDYAHSYGADGVHRPSNGYRDQGGREAKAIYQVSVKGKGWRPFYPRSVSLTGNVITVQFWVPVGSLAFDTTHIAALPDSNMGFEFTDTGSGKVTLPANSVVLKPGTTDSVTLTLSGTPSATFELRYAWTAPNGVYPLSCSSNGNNFTGPVNGPRGNVADSDLRTSWAGDPLTDYALTFRIPNISAASPYSWAPGEPNLSTVPGVMSPNNGGSSVNGHAAIKGKAVIR